MAFEDSDDAASSGGGGEDDFFSDDEDDWEDENNEESGDDLRTKEGADMRNGNCLTCTKNEDLPAFHSLIFFIFWLRA